MNVELLLVVVSQRSTNYGATAYVYGFLGPAGLGC